MLSRFFNIFTLIKTQSMKLEKHIPSFFTSLNLVYGFIAIVISFRSNMLMYAAILIFVATIFDFIDGFAARILTAFSDVGKQLDSLADVVSFGVAPGIIMFHMIKMSIDVNMVNNKIAEFLFLSLPVLIPVFSALRLAKFNVDERQLTSFIGLPTPATAILIASIVITFLTTHNIVLQAFIINKITITCLVVILSFLMVCNLPMFSLKFKSASFKEHAVQYIFLGLSALMLIVLRLYALPLIICLYIVISIILYFIKPKEV
jgi:CDP-diacylglycerol---serine O-phosphatidyltransferase